MAGIEIINSTIFQAAAFATRTLAGATDSSSSESHGTDSPTAGHALCAMDGNANPSFIG